MSYLVAALIGTLVGYSELVSRYRDQPSAILRAPSAWAYLAINAGASLAALRLVNILKWDFGLPAGDKRTALVVLACGFGAMAIIRTSLANVKIGGQDTPIGFVTVLDSFLTAADRGADRARSSQRLAEVRNIMQDAKFELAKEMLPTAVLASLQNASRAEAEDLRKNIAAIDLSTQSPASKGINLGLVLMNLVGPKGLAQAVKSLGDEIR